MLFLDLSRFVGVSVILSFKVIFVEMMRLLHTPLFFCLMIASLSAFGQDCGKRGIWWDDYERFIPRGEHPTFTIRINYVIPTREDGTGNFDPDIEEHREALEDYIAYANKLWLKLEDPKDSICYTGKDFIPSTYIQYHLNEIIVVKNNFLWNRTNGRGCPNDRTWFLNVIEDSISKIPKYANAINIYLPNDSTAWFDNVLGGKECARGGKYPPCSELPSYKNLDRSSRICISSSFNKYWYMKNCVPNDTIANPKRHTWESAISYWDMSSRGHTIAHELGHSMGLNHANRYHGRNKCHSSIMNQRHGAPHNYLQPSEIGRMHRNLRMSNIRDFVIEDVYIQKPMYIHEDEEPTLDFKSYEDIVVESGATLTLSCDMSFPAEAKIILRPGSRLIVSGGVVSGRKGSLDWGGIVLERYRRPFWRSKSTAQEAEIIIESGEVRAGSPKRRKRRKG